MPQKVRQLKSVLAKAGFISRSAKGSHTHWQHAQYLDLSTTICGNDGDDAERYQEQDVKELIQKVECRK